MFPVTLQRVLLVRAQIFALFSVSINGMALPGSLVTLLVEAVGTNEVARCYVVGIDGHLRNDKTFKHTLTFIVVGAVVADRVVGHPVLILVALAGILAGR